MQIIYNFVFLYPLFMAFLWMIGAIIFQRFRAGNKEDIALSQTPMVSILIPCHDEEKYIQETIEFSMKQVYPNFEIIAIDDASKDRTAEILSELQKKYACLRIVSLKSNQGKGTALTMGALASRSEYLVCLDADALLDPQAVRRMMWHFLNSPRVGAVTGNPRVRNRTSIIGKIQVGEFSSIVNVIKRTQRVLGKVYTVSGVVAAFRKRALLSVGFWSNNMVTEDVDVSWKLELNFWDIRYEPRALCWILMPESIKGILRQRIRWAQGGIEVLRKYFRTLLSWKQRRIWPLYLESMAGVVWSYCLALTVVLWMLKFFIDLPPALVVARIFPPQWTGTILAAVCLLQFGTAIVLDRACEKNPLRLFFWLIWYPVVYWALNATAAIIGFPKAIFKRRTALAVWESPDRGL